MGQMTFDFEAEDEEPEEPQVEKTKVENTKVEKTEIEKPVKKTKTKEKNKGSPTCQRAKRHTSFRIL